jgi:hypothetical protein
MKAATPPRQILSRKRKWEESNCCYAPDDLPLDQKWFGDSSRDSAVALARNASEKAGDASGDVGDTSDSAEGTSGEAASTTTAPPPDAVPVEPETCAAKSDTPNGNLSAVAPVKGGDGGLLGNVQAVSFTLQFPSGLN